MESLKVHNNYSSNLKRMYAQTRYQVLFLQNQQAWIIYSFILRRFSFFHKCHCINKYHKVTKQKMSIHGRSIVESCQNN